jgi:hypothetical protein
VEREIGFFVGESTYGYRSIPFGETRMDKKGRPRPEGYKIEIEPREAAVILRIFREFAEGRAKSEIVMRRVNERGATIHETLERQTARSALILRRLLGKIRLKPVAPDIGRPYLRAKSNLQTLTLLELKPMSSENQLPDTSGNEVGSSDDSAEASNSLRWWRRRESNPRPKKFERKPLRA